jgi:hypothetical protein
MSILAKEATSLTIDWKAGCGKSARPVWREGRRNSMRLPYPYHVPLGFALGEAKLVPC